MIVAPAVDVRGGRCVQLIGGDPSQEAVSLADPVDAARSWRDQGFTTLHLVDLDAALGDGHNRDVFRTILRELGGDTQVGGGVRSEDDVRFWLEAGAARVIVGTRAVDDPGWAASLASEHPAQLVIAADVRDDQVLRRGWKETSPWVLSDFLARFKDVPLGGVLVTDVGREGQLVGLDPAWLERVVGATQHPVWASGGVESARDLGVARDTGAAGVVVGMALYTGRIDPAKLDLSNGNLSNDVGGST